MHTFCRDGCKGPIIFIGKKTRTHNLKFAIESTFYCDGPLSIPFVKIITTRNPDFYKKKKKKPSFVLQM